MVSPRYSIILNWKSNKLYSPTLINIMKPSLSTKYTIYLNYFGAETCPSGHLSFNIQLYIHKNDHAQLLRNLYDYTASNGILFKTFHKLWFTSIRTSFYVAFTRAPWSVVHLEIPLGCHSQKSISTRSELLNLFSIQHVNISLILMMKFNLMFLKRGFKGGCCISHCVPTWRHRRVIGSYPGLSRCPCSMTS